MTARSRRHQGNRQVNGNRNGHRQGIVRKVRPHANGAIQNNMEIENGHEIVPLGEDTPGEASITTSQAISMNEEGKEEKSDTCLVFEGGHTEKTEFMDYGAVDATSDDSESQNEMVGHVEGDVSGEDPQDDAEQLSESDKSDPYSTEETEDQPPNDDDDIDSMNDPNFGDVESNGDTIYDDESLWNDSDSSASNDDVDQEAYQNGDENQGQSSRYRSQFLSKFELDVLKEAGIIEQSTSSAEMSSEEVDQGDNTPAINASAVHENAFMRRLIGNSNRSPPRFDPDMVFDDGTDIRPPAHSGPFSAPGQIWEDPSSEELSPSNAARKRIRERGANSLPSAMADISDNDKENVAPTHRGEEADSQNNNAFNTANNSDGNFYPVFQEPNYVSLGPLRPRPYRTFHF
ncbi:hypothetical protein LOZ66_004617 [Ophidiomyces ophidiicola]|nr:hypothetical protein LOZ66_004617 [Ophidiomyces ophidiicola]